MLNKKYQCFISSTYEDLKEERWLSINAILGMGQQPAGMEYFEAGSPQKEIIKKWMDESDLVIFIIGGRYGSIDQSTGKGYTEDEFDYVIENGKPHFSIVLSDLYLKCKEADILQKNERISIYEETNKDKHKSFLEKVCKYNYAQINSKEEISLAISKNISNKIQNGELKSGWIRCDEKCGIDPVRANLDKKQLMINLMKEHLSLLSDGHEKQKISEQYYEIFEKHIQSLKRYLLSMAYSIEINLLDDFIEVYSTANKTYRLVSNVKEVFLYNPWLHLGMESTTFKIDNFRYNNEMIEDKYIKRGLPYQTEHPFYVKDIIKVEFPFENNKEIHRVQYTTSYKTNYNQYFYEYIFKEFCQHFNLVVTLNDYRGSKKDKEYMMKWELFTPHEEYDYLSQNMLNYEKNRLTVNIADLLLPGNGYVISLHSEPIDTNGGLAEIRIREQVLRLI